jgi:hypothetical protein
VADSRETNHTLQYFPHLTLVIKKKLLQTCSFSFVFDVLASIKTIKQRVVR